MMLPTIKYARQFLALINSCKSGHFVSDKVGFGERSLSAPGAHAITAGGPEDEVHALGNVGSGKGSVFFELVEAALNSRPLSLGSATIEPPSNDGILSVYQLYSYLESTIPRIENFKVEPQYGMLVDKDPGGAQGGFFFIINRTLADQTIKTKFRPQYEAILGPKSLAEKVVTSKPNEGQSDRVVWSFLEKTGSADQIREFIKEFPNSEFIPYASGKLASLEKSAAEATDVPDERPPAAQLQELVERGDISALQKFQSRYAALPEAAKAGRAASILSLGGSREVLPADAILGTWQTSDGNLKIRIEKGRDGKEVWRNLQARLGPIGEVIGETAATANPNEWSHVGRHIWETNPPSWGSDGALVADVIAHDRVFYAYLDSRYQGGWLLQRISP
jgi:hypothetical protein